MDIGTNISLAIFFGVGIVMARNFNGSTDLIAATNTFAAPVAGTLSAWVKPGTLTQAYNGVIAHAHGPSNSFFEFFVKSSSQIAYYVNASIATVSVDPGLATISGWTHLAMCYDSTNGLKTYVNGSSDGTSGANGTILGNSGQALNIGNDPVNAGRHFPGLIADAAYWSVALTALEIAGLAKGIRPPYVRRLSLLLYYPLDGLQSPEPDLSGNKNNGTLTGTSSGFGPPFGLQSIRMVA